MEKSAFDLENNIFLNALWDTNHKNPGEKCTLMRHESQEFERKMYQYDNFQSEHFETDEKVFDLENDVFFGKDVHQSLLEGITRIWSKQLQICQLWW